MIHTMKNKYIIRSRISEAKTREIIKYFCLDIEATKISKITQISEVTLCKIFRQIRILIAKECEKTSKMQGEIEIDESYFGARRVRGKRGRGAGKKTPVFLLGLKPRNASSGEFLDETNYLNGNYKVKKVYYWRFE